MFPSRLSLTIDGESQDYVPVTPAASSITAIIDMISQAIVIAGQSIHVSCTSSVFGTNQLVDMTPKWNFGDPHGTYNVLTGFNAAHSYAVAGIYSLSLHLTAPNGAVSIATKQITVLADDRPTVYVDNFGSDGNDGKTLLSAVKSYERALGMLADGTRLMFRSGQTFDMTRSLGVELHDLTVGSYGPGFATLRWAKTDQPNPNMIECGDQCANLVVENLHFDGGGVQPYAVTPRGTSITIRNCSFMNLYSAISCEGGPSGLLVESCETPAQAHIAGYVVWMQGRCLTIIGNKFVDGGLATLRGNGVGKPFDSSLISDNLLANSSRATLTLQRSAHHWVANNTMTGTGVNIGPLGGGDGKVDPDWQHATADGVVFNANTCIFQSGHKIAIIAGAKHVRMNKNNVSSLESPGMAWVEGLNTSFPRVTEDLVINGVPVDMATSRLVAI